MDKFIEYSLRFNHRKRLDKDGKAFIEVRMYHDGIATYHSKGISVTPEGWNVDKNLPKYNHIKRNCETLIQELKTFESNFRIKKGQFRLSDFQYQHTPEPTPQPKNLSFTKFCADQLEAEKALKQPSWRTRKLSLEYFKEFRSEVRFGEVNFALVQHFDFFLNNKKLHTNTIAKHHKHFRKYIIQAIKSRLILPQDNPYIDFSVNKIPFKSQFCTEEELQRLEELNFESNERMLERCRDMFLFGCYTGLKYNDVYKSVHQAYLKFRRA